MRMFAAMCVVIAFCFGPAVAQARSPNVLLILADDKYVCLAEYQATTRQIAAFSSISSSPTYCNELRATTIDSVELTTHCYSS